MIRSIYVEKYPLNEKFSYSLSLIFAMGYITIDNFLLII